MVIKEFGAVNFRNFEELFLPFNKGIYLFYGSNGQGKTNLAEGLYLLCHLSSFRTPRLEQLIRFGQPQAMLQGLVNNKDYDRKTRIEISRGGRRVWMDEHPVTTLSSYISVYHALLFNPDHLYNYRQFPAERRQYFDRVLSFLDHGYLETMREFRAIHSQKNRLLKGSDLSTLSDWNNLFVEKSCVIIKKRQEITAKTNKNLAEVLKNLTGKKSSLELEYRPNLTGEEAEDLAALERAAPQEQQAGHALNGPHRDDYRMHLSGTGQEAYFSQGESRITLLALLLALNEIIAGQAGYHPIVILDDLYSELDGMVQENLTAYLERLANQVFITTTQPPPALAGTAAEVMEIRDGRIV